MCKRGFFGAFISDVIMMIAIIISIAIIIIIAAVVVIIIINALFIAPCVLLLQ